VDDQRVTRTARENGLGSLDAGRYQGVTRALTGLELIKTTTPVSWDARLVRRSFENRTATNEISFGIRKIASVSRIDVNAIAAIG
jgi:hypothetical protein